MFKIFNPSPFPLRKNKKEVVKMQNLFIGQLQEKDVLNDGILIVFCPTKAIDPAIKKDELLKTHFGFEKFFFLHFPVFENYFREIIKTQKPFYAIDKQETGFAGAFSAVENFTCLLTFFQKYFPDYMTYKTKRFYLFVPKKARDESDTSRKLLEIESEFGYNLYLIVDD